MRKLTGLALVVGLAASLLLYAPLAHSEPFAVGHVSGTVQTNGGLFTELACTQAQIDAGLGYTFDGVAIEGGFQDASDNRFAGSINVGNVKGKAQYCNTTASSGTGDGGNVNLSTDPATFTASGLNSIVGIFFGSYLRDGPHTQVTLSVYTRINPPAGVDWNYCVNRDPINNQITGPNGANCPPGTVYVTAEFVPNFVDHADGTWEQADFNGTWGTTKTWP